MKPHDAVYEGLMFWIEVDQGQRLGLDFYVDGKVVINFSFDPKEGQKEIIPPSPTSPSYAAYPHPYHAHTPCDS